MSARVTDLKVAWWFELIGGVAMAMLFLLGMWVLYFWLGRKCLRASAAGTRAGGRNDMISWGGHPQVKIPDTVPSAWVETYRAENGA